MSQYLNFFVKTANEYAPIGSYSRNHIIQRIWGCRTSYGQVARVHEQMISDKMDMINEQLVSCNDRILEFEKEITIVMHMDGTIEDRLEQVRAINEQIIEIKDERRELEYAKHFLFFLGDILDEGTEIYAGLEVDVDELEARNG